MRKLINEFDGFAAGKESPSPQSAFKGIVLVDCDGTLFDVKEGSENVPLLPENHPLFDALIGATKNGFAVIVHSGDPVCNTPRLEDALGRRGINQDYWMHANEDGKSQLVFDKMDSRKVVENLDPTETMPLLIIDDEASFAKTMVKIYNIIGYKAQSILPTNTAELKRFANITESGVKATHITFEASN